MSHRKFAAIMPRRVLNRWFFGLLLLAACSEQPVKNKTQLEVRPQTSARKAKPAEPPRSYRMADNQNSLHLLDADTRLQAGDSQAAQKALDKINAEQLPPELFSKYKLLQAQVALSMGDAEQALKKLEGVRPAILADADQIAYYQSVAFVHALLGDVVPSVRARLKLGRLLQKPEQQKQNIIAILDALSVLPLETLSGPSPIVDELSGWMALAKVLKQRNVAGFDTAGQIMQWRQMFPGHPANADYLQAYLNPPPVSQQTVQEPEQAAQPPAPGATIAVLLPGSGSYASAAKAIREGLTVAHRLAASAAPQMPLKYYDSEKDDIANIYKQAVSDGAKQVIGPLVKEQIQNLAQSAELSVPVLALNHVENLSNPNLYQFGLSPIDDAEQLVQKAKRDGQQNAVLLTPNTTQGERVRHYLMSAWQAVGGAVVGVESYDPKQHDFAAIVKTLLSNSVSANGQKQPLALFVSASSELARELAPQLKYSQSSELSVYAMPNIYSGRQNPVRDSELGKINFCDLPWVFGDAYTGALSQQAVQNTWQGLSDSQVKLVALGIDAYNIIGQLPQLAGASYAGATGRLSVNDENRITRKLVCAQFKGGVPVASGFVE
ncbi:penicillin-binding protein activator [Methylomonas sp. ZR1]|uniref:penicillin-binding protein activator n=1 Tax=Methylomonas sp. ZR1 TaxID=1797072 RepID=UPI00149170A5|nr:penicillin-binding protein activator [Methylomonas sp. ZR1]NOV32063.1 LppC family lipoprotein [Methylomonas sp. ZR1]